MTGRRARERDEPEPDGRGVGCQLVSLRPIRPGDARGDWGAAAMAGGLDESGGVDGVELGQQPGQDRGRVARWL
jgi:hypothetical protein